MTAGMRRRPRPGAERREDAPEIALVRGFADDRYERRRQRCRGLPVVGQKPLRARVGGVDEGKDAPQARHEEQVPLELLVDLVAGAVHASQVPVGAVQGRDEPVSYRIRRMEEDDRGLRPGRRLLSRVDRCILEGDDHVDALSDEHLRLGSGLRRGQVSPDHLHLCLPDPASALLLHARLELGLRQIPSELFLELRRQRREVDPGMWSRPTCITRRTGRRLSRRRR